MKLTPANCRVEREAADTKGAVGTSASSGLLRRKVVAVLEDEGCVWPMRDDRDCGEHVAWTCGGDLDKPRLYCDPHGSFMNQRLLRMKKRATDAKRRRRVREKRKEKGSRPKIVVDRIRQT